MEAETDPNLMKAVLHRHFDEVLNLGSVDVIDEIYSDDYVLDAPFASDGTPREHAVTSGRDGLRERVGLFRNAFPDIVFSVEEMVAEGNAVAARYVFRGTHLGPSVRCRRPAGRCRCPGFSSPTSAAGSSTKRSAPSTAAT